MKNTILFTLLIISNIGLSQDKIPFIDLEEINDLVVKSSEKGDYEKTLELLNRVNKNDSTYCSVLVTKSYYLLNSQKYDEAIAVTNEGLENNCFDSKPYFYINKGLSFAYKEDYTEALNVYNKGIETYSKNYKLWYNKGVALESLGKIKEAVVAYQNSILLNPTYKNPHLKLGNICYKQERISQALMCYNMYLLLDPDGEEAFNTLRSLNNIVETKNENEADPDFEISEDDEFFEEIDLVISNKIALNEDYTTGNKINISLTKQNHALLEQLRDFDGDRGFWDTKYVPFYRWVVENDLFDNFMYTLAYSIENEKYKKIINQNKKGVISFVEVFREKWNDILRKNVVEFEGQEEEVYYNYYNSYMQAMGKMENNVTVGNWQFYNVLGQLTVRGLYNTKGDRQGKWIWYQKNGKVKETAVFENGKLSGANFQYHENGKPHVIANYIEDMLEGEYKYYNNKGGLIQNKYYKKGQLEGDYKSYFEVGEELIEFYTPYKDDLIDKKAIEYYAHGDVYSEIEFINGKRNGLEKKYYFNKNLSAEIAYVDGELNGSYKTFYINNNPIEIGQSQDDFFHGPWKSYYKDGTLQCEYTYNKGYLDGLYKYYDTDGKIFYEYVYRKGEIISYKFYDKQEQTLKEGKKKGGEFFYVGYSPEGNITSEGLYDISGGKKGIWKFYSSNGILTGEGNYMDNEVDGEYINYHNNGQKQSISFYEEGMLNGYYSGYYSSGKLKVQGWYKDNLAHGEWRSYKKDNTLESINFYHKGKRHGRQEYFGSNGGLETVFKYNFDELISETTYDRENKELNYVNFQKEEDDFKVVYKHANDITSTELFYTKGLRHGAYNYCDYYGKKEVTGNYKNNEQDGKWTWYYGETGAVETTRNYINGNLDGTSINYYKNGSIQSESYYEYGKSTGTWIAYHDNGNKSRRTQYDNDELHGRKEFYSYLGELQLIRFYNHGRLIGYSYLDKDSNELPMIEIKNETAKIKAYFDNGNVSRELEYKNGDIINDYKIYYYSGQLENEINYADDKYHGLDIEYYPNGVVKKEQEYLYGTLYGIVKEYYDTGKIKKETNYNNNEKNGASNSYNKLGELVKKELYFNGDIYSSETY